MSEKFRILSMDGGGAKGVFSLGILEELEGILNGNLLHEKFDLIYGTSTGAILSALIAKGLTIKEIKEIYFELIPKVLSESNPSKRSNALRNEASQIFGEEKFDKFLTLVGFVTTDCDNERPKIFKNSKSQSFSRAATFESGFGATITDALMASSAAIPYFLPTKVKTVNQGCPKLIDGGFVANNPSLFAITDAVGALNIPVEDIQLISIGTGSFSSPDPSFIDKQKWNFVNGFFPAEELVTTFNANANSIDFLVSSLFPNLEKIRINGSFPTYKCDLLTHDLDILNRLHTCGRDTFGEFEKKIKVMFNLA